jgi:hypothetical protein
MSSWTPAMQAALTIAYRLEPVEVIAEAPGVSVSSVYQTAKRIGLSIPRPRVTRARLAQIRRLSLQGLTDTEIAPLVGLCRSEVSRQRRRMKLPPSAAGLKRAQLQAVRSQCATLGIAAPTELRSRAYRLFAQESGWPEDLRPREVQILNALAARGVPMTRRELSEAIGMRTDREDRPGHVALLSGNGPGGTYTASLLRRGLLAVFKRGCVVAGAGSGKSLDLYYLSAAALSILEERARQWQNPSATVS